MNREELVAEKLEVLLEFATDGQVISPRLGDTFFECEVKRYGRRLNITLENGLLILLEVHLVGTQDVPR